MSKDGTHNDLDNFLKESFKEHTIKPAPELWDKIESKFQPQVVPIQHYARLKVALYTSMVIIAGLVVILLVTHKESIEPAEKIESAGVELTPELNSESEIQQTNEPKTNLNEEPNKNIVKNSSPNFNLKEQIVKKDILTNKEEEQQKPKQLTESIPTELQPVKDTPQPSPKYLEAKTLTLNEFANNEEPAIVNPTRAEVNTSNDENLTSSNAKNSTPRKISTKTRNSHKRKKHYPSNKDLPTRKNYSNYSRKGKILDDLTVKINITPAVTQLIITDEDSHMPNYERIEMDNPGLTLNGGIELEYRLNKNWAIYTGLKTSYFKQTFEEHTYTVPSPFQDGQDLMTPAGKYLMKGDAEDVPNSVIMDAYIKLRYLDIPFVARYQINNFFFDAGINYSYLLDNHSSLNLKNNYSSLLFEKNGGFKEHAFGFTAGAGFKQTFNSGWRFELGPELKFNVNNLYTGGEVTGVPLFIGFRSAFCLSRYYAE